MAMVIVILTSVAKINYERGAKIMFCINCGKQLPDEARFCAYCGIRITELEKESYDVKVANSDDKVFEAEVIDDEVTMPKVTLVKTQNDFLANDFSMAQQYERGVGVERNLRKAFDLYLKAARAGSREAQFRLACAYENGELNLKENYEKAYDWYLKAANNGNVEAMFILAEAYNYEELDLDEDEDEAFEWYLKAARLGHVDAQVIVAEAYELENLGVDEDIEEALEWYLKAANNGNVESMYKVGDLYYDLAREIADETEDDDDEEFAVTDEEIECLENAKKWFKKAAECGHGQAARMLKLYFSR